MAMSDRGMARIFEAWPAVPNSSTRWRQTARLEVLARVKLAGVLGEDLADGAGHGHPVVGVDVDLAHPVLDATLDLLHRHAPGLGHLAAVLVDDVLEVLRHAGGAVHDQVGVGQAAVDLLDHVHGQDVAVRLAGELVGTVAGAHGHRGADPMGHVHHITGDADIVVIVGGGLAVGHQRAVHHHRGEAILDSCGAGRLVVPVVLVHADRDVRVHLGQGVDQVLEDDVVGVGAGAPAGLDDDG